MTHQSGPIAEKSVTTEAADAEAVALHLPAQSRYIRVARLVGAGLANELGLGVDRLDDIRLAIGEACGLAVHFGATALSLRYVLDERALTVSLEAGLDSGGGAGLAPEDHALIEQVLAIACSSHHIDRSDDRVTIRLSFADGH
jgi:serine/threonine-protein kinase RsbW